MRRFFVTIWRIRRDDEDDVRSVDQLHLAHVQLTDVSAIFFGVTLYVAFNVTFNVVRDDKVALFLIVEIDCDGVAEQLVDDVLGGELVVVVDEGRRERTLFEEILEFNWKKLLSQNNSLLFSLLC